MNLGATADHACVVKGPGYEKDPASLESPQHRYPYRKTAGPLRLAWRGYTGPLGDAPFHMRFSDLDPHGLYRIRIVYSDHGPETKVGLTAGDIEIHPFMPKPAPRQPIEFAVPAAAVKDGELSLTWQLQPGQGHAGTGCEISELWLLKA